MSTGANRAMLQRFWEEIFNQANTKTLDEIVAKDYLNHDLVPGEGPGSEGLKQFVHLLHNSFADLRFEPTQMVAGDDKVVTRWEATGTHSGEFMGVPATGKKIKATGMAMHRIENGKIVEAWNNWDALGLLTQLGAIPQPGGA